MDKATKTDIRTVKKLLGINKNNHKDKPLRCMTCKKQQKEVEVFIKLKPKTNQHLCNECIELCMEAIKDKRKP
jgi:hypothetical protein